MPCYALEPTAIDTTGKPSEDCLRCGRCIEACPEDAIDIYFIGTSVKVRRLFIVLSIIAVLAWYTWFVYILLGKVV
jgi:Fe-S-cluster-containing hydrogenase component 2